jgi:chemotaxis protein histidine kinase CheA
VTLAAVELYELFLALAPARLEAARAALDVADRDERARELRAALVPLAVDAALLGADGVSVLAAAAASASGAPASRIEPALDALRRAAEALGQGDASGARTDEHALRELAAALRSEPAREPPAPAAVAPPPSAATAVAEGEDPAEAHWIPTLADDMVAAFLDECVERLEGLGGRLLLLEERADDRELINEIFRDLHTLKGSSAFAGLRRMNRVAHLAEDLIGELRDGRRRCDRPLIDVLLETLDVLRAIVERARARQPIDVPVASLLERLRDPSAALPAAARPAAASGAPVPPSTVGAAPLAASSAPRVAGAAPAAAQGTLRIDFEKVDQLLNLVGEVVLARGRLTAAAEVEAAVLRELGPLRRRLATREGAAPIAEDLQRTERALGETFSELEGGLAGLGLAVGQLRDTVMKLRMVPIARLFTKYQRTVRELSQKLEKEVRVDLVGADTELDKVLVERLEDPLLHLVRNAVDHGIERPAVREAAGKPRAGSVVLSASQRGGQIVVSIADDGAGMDPERLRAKAVEKGLLGEDEARALSDEDSYALIFRAGFSTAASVSDVSGRGVGMDVVRDAITRLKGTIHLRSEKGRGSRVELRLPLTLAITQVLAARVAGELVAIPLDPVLGAQAIEPSDLEPVADGACLRVGEELIPVVDLASVLGLGRSVDIVGRRDVAAVIVETGGVRLGLLVQQVIGRHEVVVKSLGPLLSGVPCAAGATLVGDRVLLVVDLAEVARRAREPAGSHASALRAAPRASSRARVLVAEDSDVVRETVRRELVAAGFEVVAAPDGRQALEIAERESFDAVSTDVMMPGLDGYELTRALRAHPRYQRIPIVMVTSKDARIDTLRGYDAGADAYITKPADVGELVRALDSLLRQRSKPGA